MNATLIGPAHNRVDGHLKVTGGAKYAVEFDVPGCMHAWAVESTIANGRIVSLDAAAAQKAPGVRAVLTHFNAPKLKSAKSDQDGSGGILNEKRFPLSDDAVHYAGQYIALVVADTLERARYAASLVRVSYSSETPAITMEQACGAKKPKENFGEAVQINKGDVAAALADPSLIRHEATYTTPTETHNPMETSGTIAIWEAADKLTLYDATQYVKGVQDILAQAFNLPRENVRVINPFVGGAFGCKGAVWMHVPLAAMAAKMAGAPVKFSITRRSMFTGTGHRTPTRQTISLAAEPNGKLCAIQHVTDTLTSPVGDFSESCGARSTGVLYASPAIRVEETVSKVNVSTPTFMRAPGECPGTYAVECAMDELAYALKMDPVELRLVNYSATHPIKGKPWSTKHLKEAYRLASEKFGWSKRNPEPCSMRDGSLLVGWGMATATYPGYKMLAAAKVQLRANGTATVQCATHDLGTGAYTAFTQISSEALGVPFENVTFELGSSDLPFGPVAGGSNSTATVGSAIHDVAKVLHRKLAELAVKDAKSPLHNQKAGDITLIVSGRLGLKSDPGKSDAFTDILKRSGRNSIDASIDTREEEEDSRFAFQSFGTHFCEVKIDPILPRVQVTRVVSVMDCGRVINGKTARSQVMGGAIMGIGMALEEETVYDLRTGLPVTRNLADYHVPVHADIISIEPYFVGEPDYVFNPMGARGMGEIGITGMAAAVANAVYHATGKRVRDLPITLDKLI